MPERLDPPEQLVWETPPPGSPRKQSKWAPLAQALRQRPGQWALIGRDINTAIAGIINKGELVCFRPKGSFECVSRNHTSRWTGDVYARYVGDASQSPGD